MTQEFARTLKKGDVIVVPYQNRLYPGIFLDFGPKGNLRYYLLRKFEYFEKYFNLGKKPYADYLSRVGSNIVAKVSPSELSDSYQQQLCQLRDALIEKGYL